MKRSFLLCLCLLLPMAATSPATTHAATRATTSADQATPADINAIVEHHYANNNGVKIHYALAGKGPLVVMIHGFPDFWYTWRHQMLSLKDRFRIAAVDQRGYNLSGQPEGVKSYAMKNLVGDIAAVIAAEGESNAIVVGHDWGGAVAWNVAMYRPDLVRLLAILNLPHPAGIAREIATNPQQQKNSAYAFQFQKPDAHLALTAEGLAGWVTDPTARKQYVAAFERSSFEGMLAFYKANYPRPPASNADQKQATSPTAPEFPRVKAPVLMFHGLDDQALLPGGLNNTWEWLDADLTLVTVPGAGHFVQQDAAELVSATLRNWLLQRTPGTMVSEPQ